MPSRHLLLFVAFVGGYLLGSIPWGLLLTRAAGLGDVRAIGSGNIGATNVLRTGSKKLAALTLFLDGFKGYLAVVLAAFLAARFLAGDNAAVLTGAASSNAVDAAVLAAQSKLAQIASAAMAGGLGALLGHIYPVWLGFNGGKGVATYIGVLVGLSPLVGLIFCAIWVIVAVLFRYSSLSSLVAAAATPLVLLSFGAPHLAFLFALMSMLLFYKHKANIERLLSGTESKIGDRSAKQEPIG